MHGNFVIYLQKSYRDLVPVVLVFVIALALPPFELFQERAAGMLQLHLLLELFAVIVALLIAIISWHALEIKRPDESTILLAGFTAVAVIDLVHALSYDGMPRLITDSSTPKAIFFWLAGRTLAVLTLLLVALELKPPLPRRFALLLALAMSGLIFWLGSFHLDWLPSTFVPGIGVTTFKTGFEYVLCLMNVLVAGIFIYKANPQSSSRSFTLATSSLIMGMGEVVFSSYKAPSDFLNNFGHVFKVLSYVFLYRSVFVSAIRLPYEQARQSEDRFRDLTMLSSDWMWEQDKDFRFTELSQGISKAHLLTESVIGKTRWELSVLGVSQAQWLAHRQTLERHEPFKDFIYQVQPEPGHLRWFSTSGSPIFNARGEFQGYRGIGQNITERKASEHQIEFMAQHDALTKLPNRLLLRDRLEQAVTHAQRSRTKLALLFLDLDHFKNVNDSLGHTAGDALLKEVTLRLGECVRDSDTISRQGGDEFLIVLSDLTDTDAAIPVLAKIMERLQESFLIDGIEVSTSVSMGIAICPDDGNHFDALLKKADMAMYRAKEAGRNSYRFFDEAMNIEALEHLAMRNGLRRALERGEFVLHYQPQINLRSGVVTGVEALIRWNHPELGLVAPGRFISVAEESGLIVPIGDWVLHEACRQALRWKQAGVPDMIMAVNLSAVQFKRGNVEQSVLQALKATGFNPALLELELTESILIQNVENVLGTVKRLKQMGVKLSIDDFGTGYSSLSYLKRFDIDKLKIDQSFIRDLSTDPDDAAIVRAIIQMASSLNLTTIAEGVEDFSMLQTLRTFQCDEAQGYHFAHPMPAEALAHYVAQAHRY
jgi:diguanylate cyclase (GGDEF)-like protein/PAS domain S-box-containing protein